MVLEVDASYEELIAVVFTLCMPVLGTKERPADFDIKQFSDSAPVFVAHEAPIPFAEDKTSDAELMFAVCGALDVKEKPLAVLLTGGCDATALKTGKRPCRPMVKLGPTVAAISEATVVRVT